LIEAHQLNSLAY